MYPGLLSVPVAQWLEHCVSSAKVVGSIPREHMYWQKICIAWMHCKSLWIKASAKCINVNVPMFPERTRDAASWWTLWGMLSAWPVPESCVKQLQSYWSTWPWCHRQEYVTNSPCLRRRKQAGRRLGEGTQHLVPSRGTRVTWVTRDVPLQGNSTLHPGGHFGERYPIMPCRGTCLSTWW